MGWFTAKNSVREITGSEVRVSEVKIYRSAKCPSWTGIWSSQPLRYESPPWTTRPRLLNCYTADGLRRMFAQYTMKDHRENLLNMRTCYTHIIILLPLPMMRFLRKSVELKHQWGRESDNKSMFISSEFGPEGDLQMKLQFLIVSQTLTSAKPYSYNISVILHSKSLQWTLSKFDHTLHRTIRTWKTVTYNYYNGFLTITTMFTHVANVLLVFSIQLTVRQICPWLDLNWRSLVIFPHG